ncbi:MAG: hypothetical protein ACHRXM_08900 [Isosphaerales bacterium]
MITAPSNSESSIPELIQRFEQELLEAADPQVVLERYQSLHPEMAGTFRELAEAVRMLQETPRPARAGKRVCRQRVQQPEAVRSVPGRPVDRPGRHGRSV